MYLQFSKLILLIGDVVLLYTALLLMMCIRFGYPIQTEVLWSHVWFFSALFPIWLSIFYVFDLYDLSMPPKSPRFPKMLFGAMGFSFLVAIVFFYLFPTQVITPKTNLVLLVLLFSSLFTLWRLFFFGRSHSRVWWRVGLFAEDAQSEKLAQLIRSHVHMGYQPVLCHAQEDVSAQIVEHQLNMFILPMNLHADLDQTKTIYDCLGKGVVFLDSTRAFEFFARRIPIDSIDHYWFLRNVQDQRNDVIEWGKRCMDFAVALGLLLITLPLWLCVYLAIQLDDGGPLFYRQTRVGRNGQLFDILKFRTMRSDAEHDGAQWAQKNDTRVTRVGRLLRRTHLDELPQVLNVLKGEISLVGPRPERPEFVQQLEKEIPHYSMRHLVKPGVTGWAQIRFRYARSVTDAKMKFEYDLYYIKNRSLVMDILVLIKTIQLVFRKEE